MSDKQQSVLPLFSASSSSSSIPANPSSLVTSNVKVSHEQQQLTIRKGQNDGLPLEYGITIDPESLEVDNSKNKNFLKFMFHWCRNNKTRVFCTLFMLIIFIVFLAIIRNLSRKKIWSSSTELDQIIEKVASSGLERERPNSSQLNDDNSNQYENNDLDKYSFDKIDEMLPIHKEKDKEDHHVKNPAKGQSITHKANTNQERREKMKFLDLDDENGSDSSRQNDNTNNDVTKNEITDNIINEKHIQKENKAGSNGFPPEMEMKRQKVKEAFQHAFNGYKKYAWGKDELKPVTRSYGNWIGTGVGLTLVDSLDTMIIMGLKDEFEQSLNWIKNYLRFDHATSTSLFETTIRLLGGLLSAYELTEMKEPILLEKAIDLGNRLLSGFNSPSGIPYATVHLTNPLQRTNPGWTGGASVLSEFMTLQLEFRKLSQLSGDPKYDQAVTRVMDKMQEEQSNRKTGLFPTFYNNANGYFTNDHVTLGAWGDSAYEYLIKQYLLSNRTESRYLDMYMKSADGIIGKLLLESRPNKLLYICEAKGAESQFKEHKMDHLVCFAGGMFALGHHTNIVPAEKAERHLEIGKQITKTCNEMYVRQPTGISSETVIFNNPNNDFYTGVPTYLLRPETVESLFVLYRATKDPIYQEQGWKIFSAIEKHCKISTGGYSGIRNVGNANRPSQDNAGYFDNLQQSFFMAETLKYLYLLFSPHELINLNEWVFNTEAHPLRIYNPKK